MLTVLINFINVVVKSKKTTSAKPFLTLLKVTWNSLDRIKVA